MFVTPTLKFSTSADSVRTCLFHSNFQPKLPRTSNVISGITIPIRTLNASSQFLLAQITILTSSPLNHQHNPFDLFFKEGRERERERERERDTYEFPTRFWNVFYSIDRFHVDRVWNSSFRDPNRTQQVSPMTSSRLFERSIHLGTENAVLRWSSRGQKSMSISSV